MSFCHKCPQCCSRSKCRGQTTEILASLARFECKSSSSLHPRGGLHPSLQAKTPFNQVSIGSKQLCKSNQKHVSQRRSRKSHEKVGSGKGGCQVLPGVLQPPFPGSQTQQEMEANSGFESLKSVPQHGYLQDGNPGDNPVVLEDRGVGHIAGFQQRILPYPNCPQVKKVSQVFPVPSNFSVHSPTIWVGHGSTRVHQGGQRSETHGSSKGYQDPPVPRRLVTESPFARNLPTTYPDPLGPMSAVRLGSKHEQVRVSSQAGLQFCRLPVRPDHQAGASHSRPMASPSGKVEDHEKPSQLYGQTIHVLDRTPDSHREAGMLRSPSYEAHSVAFKEELACPRGPGENYSGPTVSPSSFRLVAGRNPCAKRSTPAPSSARRSTIYRRLKQRLGRTLRELHCKRRLVIYGKSPAHKLSRAESSPSGSPTVRASVQGSDCACCHRQHNSSLIHKQARGYEVRLSLCPPLETPVLVPSQGHSPEGKTHSGTLECDSGQAFQTQSSDPNRVVSLSTGVQSIVLQVGSSTSGFVCHPVQSQTTQLCVTGSEPDSLGSERPELILGTPERVRFPSSLSDPTGSLEVKGSRLSQDDSHCPGLA